MSGTAKFVRTEPGFTLIELLVSITIIAILLSAVIIAINPARQFQESNDTKRKSDITAILNAIDQFAAEKEGQIPAGITTSAQYIQNGASDICTDLVPQYLAKMPVDPSVNNGTPIAAPCPAIYTTGYQVQKSSSDNRITVSAPYASAGTIFVTR